MNIPHAVPNPDEVARRIVAAMKPRKIILFGSAARGTLRQDSDLDFLIVLDAEVGSRRAAANRIDLLRADRLTPMDFLVMTPDQFEAQRRIAGTVAANADAEGKALYDVNLRPVE